MGRLYTRHSWECNPFARYHSEGLRPSDSPTRFAALARNFLYAALPRRSTRRATGAKAGRVGSLARSFARVLLGLQRRHSMFASCARIASMGALAQVNIGVSRAV